MIIRMIGGSGFAQKVCLEIIPSEYVRELPEEVLEIGQLRKVGSYLRDQSRDRGYYEQHLISHRRTRRWCVVIGDRKPP
jgi:hypothetical protein